MLHRIFIPPAGGGEGRAALSLAQRNQFRNDAPVITVFDHRGCKSHSNSEYKGPKANGQDDEMLVKLEMKLVPASPSRAASQLAESISLKQKGIDGDYTGGSMN